jgi:hypothetical protein
VYILLEVYVLSILESKYIMNCSRCQEEKTQDEMSVRSRSKKTYKKYCKKCAALMTKEYIKRNPRDTKKDYQVLKSKLQENTDYTIRYWCSSWKQRKGDRFAGRKEIPLDTLVYMVKDAMVKFPYLSCCQNKPLWQTPSVDRIDSSKPYSVDNIIVIPLWLNSAKLDMSLDKIHELMKDYIHSF